MMNASELSISPREEEIEKKVEWIVVAVCIVILCIFLIFRKKYK